MKKQTENSFSFIRCEKLSEVNRPFKIDCTAKRILKVALGQKRLDDFYIAKINILNHYPEQKI